MHSEKNELVPIVDNNDIIIGHKLRYSLQPVDIYRIAGLWVVSETGMILLSQRHTDKNQEAGKWDTAVAGTVQSDESYETAIVREAYEELGLYPQNLKVRTKLFIQGSPSYFCQTFSAVVSQGTDFTVNKQEIAQIGWFEPKALDRELARYPNTFTPGVAWALANL